jgi:hypothetical protein
MAKRTTPRNIDEYISAAPRECQPILEKIQYQAHATEPNFVKAVAPRCVCGRPPARYS